MTVAPGAPPGTPNLLALKILVVVMGIAIVAGVIVIVVAVSNRLSETETAAQAGAAGPQTIPGTKAASAAMGDHSIAVPEGCVMADADIEGNRLIVRLDGLAERGCQQIVLIDLTSGRVLGRITAEPGP